MLDRVRKFLNAAVLVGLMLGVSGGEAAETEVEFDLPEQPLAASLRALANRSGTNILFDQKVVEGLRAPALKAQLTPREAIARLLAGTGVAYEFINEHTVVLAANAAGLEAQKNKGRTNGTDRAR